MSYLNKVPGYGTLVGVDDDDSGATFTTVGCIKEVTPPPLERNTIDGTCLEDAIEVMDPGTEKATDFEFLQIWKVKNTNAEIIDTLYNSKNKVLWNVTYPQDVPVVDSFEGWVKKVAPEVKGPNDYWQRKITIQRTSTITRT